MRVGVIILAIAIQAQAAQKYPTTAPDTVVLKELMTLYEPVPFDHKTHATMAEMWEGCTTCHHRSPKPTTQPTTQAVNTHSQDSVVQVPACKSCHEIPPDKAAIESVDIRMPSLKGAYHRQCLNCHREWMHGNACVICHKPLDGAKVVTTSQPMAPSKDDIVGRMHPPLEAPAVTIYKARFTPAVGANAIFRHETHVKEFGLKCVHCHRKDNCSHCHDPKMTTTRAVAQRPMRPGKTWKDSHEPCVSCHQSQRCAHCHYKEGQPAPVAFTHASTGQELDKDHVKLTCGACHPIPKMKAPPTCGGKECHDRPIAFPDQRPGPVIPVKVVLSTTRPTDGVRRVRR